MTRTTMSYVFGFRVSVTDWGGSGYGVRVQGFVCRVCLYLTRTDAGTTEHPSARKPPSRAWSTLGIRSEFSRSAPAVRTPGSTCVLVDIPRFCACAATERKKDNILDYTDLLVQKWPRPQPESGLDSLVCAEFIRERPTGDSQQSRF